MEAQDTLTAIAEAMTPQQVAQGIQLLKAKFSPRADIWLSVSGEGEKPLCMFLGATFTNNKHTIYATSYPDLFAAADTWVVNQAVVRRDTTIRKMALAIIELTDEHGACKRADLERRFSEGEVAEFSEAACVRAGEMAGAAPFEVTP